MTRRSSSVSLSQLATRVVPLWPWDAIRDVFTLALILLRTKHRRRLGSSLVAIVMVLAVPSTALSTGTLWGESWEDNWTLRWHVDGGTWQVGMPTSGPGSCFAGQNCAATILDGPYPEPADSRLVRDVTFVVPAVNESPRLRFWHWFSFNCGDYGVVQLRVGSGPWANVSTTYASTGGGVWTRPSIDLSAYADSTVQIAFFFHSEDVPGCDGSPDVDAGWYIDEVELVTKEPAFTNPEDFESGLGDWASERGTWEVGAPSSGPPSGAHSGTNCAATVLAGDYSDYVDSRLTSSSFVVSAADQSPRLRFWHWFSFNCGDYGVVQLRVGSGPWANVSTTYASTGGGVWTRPSIDLSAYADSTVQIAFFFHSEDVPGCDGSPDVDAGWYVDDVELLRKTSAFTNPEDFESGLGDWASERGTWEVGAPSSGPGGAHSGTNCAATVLAGNYSDYADTRLISPDWIRASGGNPSVGFWHWFSFNCGDYGEVQVQDSLGSWTRIASCDRFTGPSGGWTFSRCSLVPYIGHRVRVGFFFHSEDVPGCDGSPDVDAGWYVDEIAFDAVTSTVASLASALAEPGRVRVSWYVAAHGLSAMLYRQEQTAGWNPLKELTPDGTGVITYEDRAVLPGRRYGYRLGILEDGLERFFGETWVTVPTAAALFLEGLRPNPNTRDLIVSFSLPSAQPARIELIDPSGRCVRSQPLSNPEPGSHLFNLGPSATVAPGVYLVRLTQGGGSVVTRACIIR